MKKYLMGGIAALTLCAGFTSCSHDDIEPMTQAEIDKAKYDFAFLNYVGGKIAADQDWGFGTTTRGLTRAATSWDGVHNCFETNWEDKLNFSLPAGAVQLDSEENMYYDEWYHKAYVCKIPDNATAIYVSKDFNGEFIFDGNISNGVSFYNYGTITGFKGGNFTGTTTIYNVGTMTYNVGQQDHNIVNIGTLKIKDNDACAKILTLYNSGHIEFLGNPAQLHSKSTYYSTSEATIDFPYGGTIESTCDIHGTINVTGNLNIQTDTRKYICGIVATGRIQNTAGELVTSYMEADDIYFEGNELYLLPGAHVKAATIEIVKDGCNVYAAPSSNALVEATDFEFQNKNDFTHTFIGNVYFKVNDGGSIEIKGCFKNAHSDGSGQNHTYTDLNEFLANTEDEYDLVADRLNAGNATGSPACGQPWSIGDEETDQYDLRIIAEDLNAEGDTDFDFNDVVFDVKFGDNATIKLLAAGGTLPLYINDNEVHGLFGVDQDYMVNTNAAAKGLKGSVGTTEKEPVVFQLTGVAVYDAADARDKIKIEVVKNGQRQELTAVKGEPAAKIAVGVDYEWLEERTSIKGEYPNFLDWVDGTKFSSEWWK